jgi:hypothetical protein
MFNKIQLRFAASRFMCLHLAPETSTITEVFGKEGSCSIVSWDADRDHSEWANIETMAHSGTEASLDFYTLPASGIAKFMKGQGSSQLIVRPVVRVQMNIFELERLLR